MLDALALIALSLAPAAGGALAWHLVGTRRRQPLLAALAVGQVPVTRRRARRMAVRREAQA